MPMLEIKDLHVSADGKEILKGVDLRVNKGEVHALMGPNGSGKSTLSYAIMGHPKCKITKGYILYEGKSILNLSTDERAKLGLFLSFQNPIDVPGVSLSGLLFTLHRQTSGDIAGFKNRLAEKTDLLSLDSSFIERDINAGLSGGERKRTEVLQMLMQQPDFAVLDETDSGLDIDSLKLVAGAVNTLRNPEFGALLITHYQRILNHLKPDVVHIMNEGRIVTCGGPELVEELEQHGYSCLKSCKGCPKCPLK